MDNKVVINEMKILYPEGFHVMDALERSELNQLGNDPSEMLFDPDRHMTVSIGWKRIGIGARMNSVKDIMRSTEAGISKAMQPYGYKFIEDAPLEIDGEPAHCFSYEYVAKDTEMCGITVVVKHVKSLYNIHLYTRRELKEANMDAWNELLASTKWL